MDSFLYSLSAARRTYHSLPWDGRTTFDSSCDTPQLEVCCKVEVGIPLASPEQKLQTLGNNMTRLCTALSLNLLRRLVRHSILHGLVSGLLQDDYRRVFEVQCLRIMAS